MNLTALSTRWAAIGAAVAVTLGAGSLGIVNATSPSVAVAYVPITPCRLVDTRPAPDTVGARTSPLGPDETFTVTARGSNGDCADGSAISVDAIGLQLNVTAIGATSPTFLTVWAADADQPTASNLNPLPGQGPVPNAVTTGLSADGKLSIYNKAGNVNVFVDVVGYYTDHNHDDRYYTKEQADAAIDAKLLYAQLSGSNPGTIVRQSGGISVSNTSAGTYFITFPRDVTDCVYTATLGGATVFDNVSTVLNRYGISATIGNDGGATVDPDEVVVAVWDNDHDAGSIQANQPFSIVVTCP